MTIENAKKNKYECKRCCYFYNIEDMIDVDDAYWCDECNDVHSGLICLKCFELGNNKGK